MEHQERRSEVVSAGIIDNIFIDLDGVTADFDGGMAQQGHTADHFKLLPGSYIWLDPMPQAIESINLLQTQFPGRIWFLTKPPKFSPYAYVEKALWVQRHFGNDGLHALIVAQDKSLVGTEKSILIDDRPHKGGVGRFRGLVIHFGSQSSEILDAESFDVRGRVMDWSRTLLKIEKTIRDRLGSC